MKKVFLTALIALSGIISAHGQCYLGGSLSLDVSSQSVNQLANTANPSYSFSLSPEIGYNLNEKMDIGLSFSIGTSSSKISNIGMSYDGTWVEVKNESNTKSYRISPYFRYSIIKWKKFNLLGSINVYASTDKIKYSYSDEILKDTKQTSFGTSIYPVLIYYLSNKWALLANLNFFRFGFSRIKIDTDSPETTTIENDFNLGLTTENLLPAIGLIYRF